MIEWVGIKTENGEMSEWSKEHAWKACIEATLSGVQIPFSPPIIEDPYTYVMCIGA